MIIAHDHSRKARNRMNRGCSPVSLRCTTKAGRMWYDQFLGVR